jgi:hypothetical protein
MNAAIFGNQFTGKKCVQVDLTERGDCADIVNLSERITACFRSLEADLLYGGYLEKRNFYQSSILFKNDQTNRNIHLGIDYWVSEGTSVYLPCDAELICAFDNSGYLNYGPTLIFKLYTSCKSASYLLFGHMQRKALSKLKINSSYAAGTCIGAIGERNENGEWPPHLHLQLFTAKSLTICDFPGLCSEDEITYYQSICPKPEFIISE